jgi:carboxyl-terminal processing protease
MPGGPHRIRRGATLTLVFGAVLATGAATGSFGETGKPGPRTERAAHVSAVPPAPSPTPAGASAASAGGSAPDTADIARAIDRGVAPAAAARLVSGSGDRWSAFYTPQQYQGFAQELNGSYVGVGLWVRGAPDGRITVSRVQPTGPARRAGLKVGDTLVAVGGTPVTGHPVTDVVSRLRGVNPAVPGDAASTPAPAPGSAVTLGVRRGSHSWNVTLRRITLTEQAVTVTHPASGVTSIAVGSFVRGVGAEVRSAIGDGDHRDGILLDLRGDSGGLVTEAVDVASDFLDGGLVATYDVHGRPYALYANPGGDTTTPLVVLVDGGTMSAAEMLTGALQDRGRAVVVGSRTFGKGSVQMPSTLADGSVAELTVGHYRTPTGQVVDGRGIRPDLTVGPGRGVQGGPDGQNAVAAARTVLSGLGTRS